MRSTVTCHRYLQNLGDRMHSLGGGPVLPAAVRTPFPSGLSRRPGVERRRPPGARDASGWFLRVAGGISTSWGNASLQGAPGGGLGAGRNCPRPVSPFPLLTKHGAAPPRPVSLLRGHPSTEFQGTTRLEGRQFLELREPQPSAAGRRRLRVALLPPAPRPRVQFLPHLQASGQSNLSPPCCGSGLGTELLCTATRAEGRNPFPAPRCDRGPGPPQAPPRAWPVLRSGPRGPRPVSG